jgi:hypothetical protein
MVNLSAEAFGDGSGIAGRSRGRSLAARLFLLIASILKAGAIWHISFAPRCVSADDSLRLGLAVSVSLVKSGFLTQRVPRLLHPNRPGHSGFREFVLSRLYLRARPRNA